MKAIFVKNNTKMSTLKSFPTVSVNCLKMSLSFNETLLMLYIFILYFSFCHVLDKNEICR